MQSAHYKGVGLNIHTHIHWTDHLAPLCVAMDIPLLLTDAKHARAAQSLYPQLQIQLVDLQDVNLQYLVENFDVFFQSQFWPRSEFYRYCQPWEKYYGKTVRNVHCPHGFSDKVFWHQQSAWEDILLIYGDNMLDLLRESGLDQALNVAVRTGNYRYLYYRQHQTFFDQIAEQILWGKLDRSKPTILYAPTKSTIFSTPAKQAEEMTSFFVSDHLLAQLPADYNLVVKLHPHLEETEDPILYRIMGKYENKANLLFLKDCPLVYPFLACADIYVGDMSSVGYDFLVFNRPMFFLNQMEREASSDRYLFLYRCGFEIKPKDYHHFYQLLERQLPFDQERYAAVRQKVYHYTFGEEIPFTQLKKAITQAFFSPKKEEALS